MNLQRIPLQPFFAFCMLNDFIFVDGVSQKLQIEADGKLLVHLASRNPKLEELEFSDHTNTDNQVLGSPEPHSQGLNQPHVMRRAQLSGEVDHKGIGAAPAPLLSLPSATSVARPSYNGSHGILSELGAKGLVSCYSTMYAPQDPCPPECAYLSEESFNPCHFQCVAAENCGLLDVEAKIADENDKRCRRCRIQGCDQCVPYPTDRCHKCLPGYFLNPKEGLCYTHGFSCGTLSSSLADRQI